MQRSLYIRRSLSICAVAALYFGLFHTTLHALLNKIANTTYKWDFLTGLHKK